MRVESRYFFTSRFGGVSRAPFESNNLALHVGDDSADVEVNRNALARQVGVRREQFFFMNQVHGDEVVRIDENSDFRNAPTCDALITQTPGVALAVLVADCAPILLMGERTTAAIHVGWRGLFAGIIERTIEQFGAEKFSAHIGPSICGECYEIGADLAEQAQERGFMHKKSSLDIPRSALGIIKESGGERVISAEWNGECTLHGDLYYSFRRDGITGRQAGVVVHGS